ncbi:MAG: YcgN family cysteine cluster protein [Rhodobacteraceae bacterium]|nr:YcgN family cysteine cluster protein [Paracoccaceae bacterium]
MAALTSLWQGGQPVSAEGGLREKFWERHRLGELTADEWEALCDGCGLCCLLKYETEGDTKVTYTNVACKLFDCSSCRCRNYEFRKEIVPDCVRLTPENIDEVIDWMPSSCAYRLMHEGKPLFDWHHLISGSSESVHAAGISVQDRCIPEFEINTDDLEKYAVDWR